MCGIAGLVDVAGKPPSEMLLRDMLGLIRHRGPDAAGIYRDDHAGLAHARLSIVDVSGGDQPVHNEDGTVWTVFNGEVFNHLELRADLERRGHRFYTRSDTEVLVHLYEDRGPAFVEELNGQFAFAIWDARRKSLMLGRDRLGVRPLFYHHRGGRLWFGSEVKAIFADPRVPRALSPRTLGDVFTGWAPLGADTPFLHVEQLPPGHWALFSPRGLALRRYWQLSFAPWPGAERGLAELSEELDGLLRDAVRLRLRADVPVGAYLSGGLDSTLISALVRRHFDSDLRTFSVGFTDGRFDEAPFQEQAVRALGTRHRLIRCTEDDVGEVFPHVVWHTEAPMLRTAPAPLYRLSRLVRDNDIKVVLTGEGADELFAGYDIFKEDRIRRFWARRPESTRRPRLLDRLYPDIFSGTDERGRGFVQRFFKADLSRTDSPVYSHLVRWGNTAQLRAFFARGGEAAASSDPGAYVERFTAGLPGDFMRWDPLSRAQYIEVSIFLSNYLLSSQGDRVAMAHAVEGRFPFLDPRVVEFACALPPRYRLCGLRDKFILRRVAETALPPELAHRPKRPYRAPISRCFVGGRALDYAEELLSPRALHETGYFDPSKVGRLWTKCRRNDGRLLSERENMAVVGILSTQLLHRLFVSGFPSRPPRATANVKVFDFTTGSAAHRAAIGAH